MTDTTEYLNDVIGTTLQCTKTTVSSALMTVTCFSTPMYATEVKSCPAPNEPTGVHIAESDVIKQEISIDDEEKRLLKAIEVLEQEKELYDARALYASRQADRILTLDFLAYREYQREAILYKDRSQQTEKNINDLKQKLENIRKANPQK